MECAHTSWISNREYLEQFNRKIVQLRVPLSGSIDLTHRCNLKCVHCYVGMQENTQEMQRRELKTHQLLSIIDHIADAGCLYLLLTGGEPFIRQDFQDVYRHAKSKGMLITVFTNATMLTENIIALFEDLPPRTVEITLYGATAKTYERITGIHGSFDRCMNAIERLLEHKVHVSLKTILMTLNRDELLDMKDMAKKLVVKFRFDAALFPRMNGDKAPLGLRVSPGEAVDLEFLEEERMREWKDFFERYQGTPLAETLYNCGAGITSFHIDPYGMLKPCLMTDAHSVNLLSNSFASGWRNAIPHIRQRKAGVDFVCTRCDKKSLCGYCPAFFSLENGSEEISSEYLCAMGRQRFQKIQQHRLQEDYHEKR